MVMSLSGGVTKGGFRLLDILVARTFDARVPGGELVPGPEIHVRGRLDATIPPWSHTGWNGPTTSTSACSHWRPDAPSLLLWFRKRSSAISALILLAGGFSWYYVMFQHTHIHHFVGQYSFMAICPIFGLIAGEAIIAVRRAVASCSRNPSRRQAMKAAIPSYRFGMNVVGAVLIVAASLQTIRCLERSYGLVAGKPPALSHSVEAKYRQTVTDICTQHSEVTLSDLQQASQ